MEPATYLQPIAAIAAIALFTTLFYIASFVAPLAFRCVPGRDGDEFVRALLRGHAMISALLAIIATVALVLMQRGEAIAMGMVAIGFLANRFWLMPRTHEIADARASGQQGLEKELGSLQRRGGFLHLVQAIAVLSVALRLVTE